MNSRIVTFEHSELGTLEVLVTGIKSPFGPGMDAFKVYYGAYDITKDLSEEDRLKVLKAVEEK